MQQCGVEAVAADEFLPPNAATELTQVCEFLIFFTDENDEIDEITK